MSRALVKEDTDGPEPQYNLPKRGHPDYDEASAWALIEGANVGDSRSAELASGYAWGDPQLIPHIEAIKAKAIEQDDERIETLANRYLRTARP
jgi:hypothetical protein